MIIESVRAAWIRQIDANRDQPDILTNAAAFFEIEEPSRSEVLLKRALRLQPENKFRLAALANFYTRAIASCDINADRCLRSRVDHAIEIELESSDNRNSSRRLGANYPFPESSWRMRSRQDRRFISLTVIETGGGTALNQALGVVRGANTFSVK